MAVLRAPKLPASVPKPLSVADAAELIAAPAESATGWQAKRDVAVLTLLYGCGLRISEALGLKRKDFPPGEHVDAITVIGKGNKARMVPVLAQVAALVAEYIALCPYEIAADGPLFVELITGLSEQTPMTVRGAGTPFPQQVEKLRGRLVGKA